MDSYEIKKPKIGTMAIGLREYWPQFPGMKDHLAAKHTELVAKIGDSAVIVEGGLVDSPEQAYAVGLKFQAEDVDVVFCQAMTYSTSSNMVPAVKDLKVPVVLFNIQEEKALDFPNVKTIADWLGHGCTCAGLAELSAMLRRYELRFDIVTGYLNGDDVVDRNIEKWCKAASVRRKMKSSNIGLLGRQYLGMMDLYVDENAVMKQFGMMTRFLMWEDVIKLSETITAEEKDANIKKLRSTFSIPESVTVDEINNVGLMYGGFMKMVKDQNLSILANHFEKPTVGKENELMAALNPSHTMMNKDGIACTVEGDIKGALAMTILRAVGGSANLTELYSMDFNDDICIIGHSGASDPNISDLKPVLNTTTVFHGKSGSGFTTQAIPRVGPITMLALTMDADGSFKMVAAEGIVEDGQILNLGDTNCRVRFKIPMREFVNGWCMTGPSHHGVMGSGAHIEALEAVSKVLGVKLEIVTRL
jgi:L-arabinose isomerase